MGSIKKITKEVFGKISKEFYSGNSFSVTINCLYIQTWEQLAEALGNAFQFPIRNEGFDGTWDWMTDLSWLGNHKEISICFCNERELFKNNSLLKKKTINFFEELIQFWEEDVKKAFISGKRGEPKSFNIYFVD